ncbi:LLM class flavin-dependent oxidoreductase [Pontibacter akesuensis]|uniref:Luciferase-like monooxygenase n=1 Tax=Pontibacter akesuensis TaxID=388950 RepID=A0A1I7H2R5_9BACT|nr:LLM class flavin-dependent oxidoreductase [Pontibacter akesuensis]GHA53767.1 alkane 1-monooxygenase [Pontibacter akesuensis]SFU54994.1 luciferase family oxidoreductase, group 1 [Pontibacter akesuensis]
MSENKQKRLADIPVSVLDLVHILDGKTAADSYPKSLELAQHVEKLGYTRFWMAEHHNMQGIASSATSVLIGYIAGGTSTIRVGSGGIMLPNHAPLVVAEQFGTLASLYPGRIDLGLGRAPGTDQRTAMALRRNIGSAGEDFPTNVQELQTYLSSENKNSPVRAVPGEGLDIPIWLLGSSTFGAQLAAILGLPYAFASHFAPASLHAALKVYRDNFQPSEQLQEPHAMACVNVIAADTDAEALRQSTSLYRAFLNVIRGTGHPLQPPVDSMNGLWDASERYAVSQMLRYSFVGSPATVQEEIQAFVDETQVDEIMVASTMYDHTARLRSYEILADLFKKVERKTATQEV